MPRIVSPLDMSGQSILGLATAAAGTNTQQAATTAFVAQAVSVGNTTGNAGTVTTNANLTGHIVSTGNAAVLGSFTLAQLNTAVSDADFATLAGPETLTNKTLTSPTLTTPALGVPASGTVTNLTGTASININGTVGATTPDTGAFTTTTVSGKATMNGGRQSAYTAKTAAYTVAAATDYCIHCTTGTFAVTLPTAVGIAGQEFIIKNSGAGVITVATTSSQTIDGAATAILSTQYGSLSVMSDGANYFIN